MLEEVSCRLLSSDCKLKHKNVFFKYMTHNNCYKTFQKSMKTTLKCQKLKYFRSGYLCANQMGLASVKNCHRLLNCFIFSVYHKILQILTAKPGECYAGEDIALPEFESLPLPEEFLHARDHKLLPVYVMPEDAEEMSKVFKFISANFKVT
jgi:hypothetical protein